MNNRDLILNRALDLFSRFGYEATGVQEVCDAAGITKPTLYHYFNNKAGLLSALLQSHFNYFLPALEQAADYHQDLTLNLEKVIRVYFQFAAERPVFYRLTRALRHAPEHSESFLSIQPWEARQLNSLQTLFTLAEAQHGNMRGRARPYALTFLGMINAYISDSLDHHQLLDDALLFQARHQFMHGIFS